MTLPTIVPAKYNGTVTDFLVVKADRSGALRMEPFSDTVPATTVTGVIIGMVPFRKGARLVIDASEIFVDTAAGASATANIGVVYNDNVTFTNNQTLYASGVSTNAIGRLVMTPTAANEAYSTLDDGWFVITTAGATTTNQFVVHGQMVLTYDPVN